MFPQNYIPNITILYLKCIVTIMLLYASDRYIQFWYASENIIKQILHFYCVGYQVYYYPRNDNIPRVVINLDIQHSSVQYLLNIN